MTILSGDDGASTTRLALVSAEGGPRQEIARQTFPSADHNALLAGATGLGRGGGPTAAFT